MFKLKKKTNYCIITIDEFNLLDLDDLNYNETIYVYWGSLHELVKEHLNSLELSHMNRMNNNEPWNNIFIIENCDYIDIEPVLLHSLMMNDDYTLCEIVLGPEVII